MTYETGPRRKRIEELLAELEQAAIDDRNAGRLIWADKQLELATLVRQMFDTDKNARRRNWRKWYETKGKAYAQKRKEREALKDAPERNPITV